MSGFVYIWYDRKHKRFYIGCHWGKETDGYICSSPWMKQAHKRRPEDFKRRIIKRVYTSRQDLFLEENRWLQMIKPSEMKSKYYNLRIIEYTHWSADKDTALSVREKISKSKLGKKRPKWVCDKIAKIQTGKKRKPHTKETRLKMSISMRNNQPDRSGSKNPAFGKRWYNDGKRNFLRLPSSAEGLKIGLVSHKYIDKESGEIV